MKKVCLCSYVNCCYILYCTLFLSLGDRIVRREMAIVSYVERCLCWLYCTLRDVFVDCCLMLLFFVLWVYVFIANIIYCTSWFCRGDCLVRHSVDAIVLYVERCTRWLYRVSRDVFVMFRLFANSCALLFPYTIGINCFTWYRLLTATSGVSHILDRL